MKHIAHQGQSRDTVFLLQGRIVKIVTWVVVKGQPYPGLIIEHRFGTFTGGAMVPESTNPVWQGTLDQALNEVDEPAAAMCRMLFVLENPTDEEVYETGFNRNGAIVRC